MSSSERILVIDDEQVICESCQRVLSEVGYEVTIATNSSEGLDRARKGDFDAVIVDLRMPETSGLEILRGIRTEKPGTQVVMITAFPSADTAVESMRLGAIDYLLKPFTPEELRSKVREALGRKKIEGAVSRGGSAIKEKAAGILIPSTWDHSDAFQEIAQSEGCAVSVSDDIDEVLEKVRKGEVETLFVALDVFAEKARELVSAIRNSGRDIPVISVSCDPTLEPSATPSKEDFLFCRMEPFAIEDIRSVGCRTTRSA
jgi:DNA-binding NtrC family response regulator